MKSLAIIGGETHLAEITRLAGKELKIVGACIKPAMCAKVLPDAAVPNYISISDLFKSVRPEIVAIANENDRKFEAIMESLQAGCDVIVDKPLCLTLEEQRQIEIYLHDYPDRRLLNLLTLRGDPAWSLLRDRIKAGELGQPVFVHIRMAVQLKRASRPEWFLDCRRSGGLFLDLLIHGLDQVEWLTGAGIAAMTAKTGNLGDPSAPFLRDHAAVFCELDNGGSAVVEGQRLLPDTQGSDYRALVAGTQGFADLQMTPRSLRLTSPRGAQAASEQFPAPVSIVKDWLAGGDRVPQAASLRANRLAVLATLSAERHQRTIV